MEGNDDNPRSTDDNCQNTYPCIGFIGVTLQAASGTISIGNRMDLRAIKE